MSEPSTELAEISARIASDPAGYWRDEGLVQRHRGLLEAEASGATPPAKPTGVAAELAAISAERRKNPSAFWKNQALVARERELFEAQLRSTPSEPAESAEEIFKLPTPAAWGRLGFDPAAHAHAARIATAADFLAASVPAEARDVLRHGFHGLPDGAQTMALAELGNRRPVAAEAVTQADVEALRARLPALAREWGSDAPQRLGAARARLWRALGAMDDADAIAAVGWLDNLPASAMSALVRAIS